ncbi:Hypothetical predicted protein [Pelobates cultripes]|uniref:Reverse transcriptase domain-containing protein n=1 Tax=Pelobates cultripes TaxID=61616 RepID=A0AAD1T243_PELCU|nr:Hypothetical predicted protein [Pelobates cultripes]
MDRRAYGDRAPAPNRNDKLYATFLGGTTLLDIWRAQHPADQDFTYYSHTHRSYSRIDSFLISQALHPWTIRSSIGNITWMDHAEITLDLRIPRLSRPWRWRLNPWILRDKGTVHAITDHLKTYFDINATEDMAPATVWAAHKVTIRGQLIAIATAQKKRRLQDLMEALADLTKLEKLHKQNPSDDLLKQLATTREHLRRLSTADVAWNLMWTKQRCYEKGNKADSLLAHCLKKRQDNKRITKIKTSRGEITNNPDIIAQEFLQYYTNLYNHSDPPPPTGDTSQKDRISSFLQSLNLPTLPAQAQARLEREEYAVAAYADDDLLTLADPLPSLHATLEVISEYSNFSGYKLNLTKSILMPVAMNAQQLHILRHSFPFKVTTTHLTYLGTRLPQKLDDTYDLNYKPLLTTAHQDLQRWDKLGISWLGRVTTVKMNLLPRFLYLFQTLPIPIRKKDFCDLQAAIDKFISIVLHVGASGTSAPPSNHLTGDHPHAGSMGQTQSQIPTILLHISGDAYLPK